MASIMDPAHILVRSGFEMFAYTQIKQKNQTPSGHIQSLES